MRFMVMVKANKDTEAGLPPTEQLLKEMMAFNEELVKAGVMLAGEGLHPSSKGARVKFSGAKRTVVDGPFAETKELVAGFWLIQTRSLAEAVEWVKRVPNPTGERVRDRDPAGVRDRGAGSRRDPGDPRAGSAPAVAGLAEEVADRFARRPAAAG